MSAEQPELLDVIGVGIGPFNLGMAALLDKMPNTKAMFFDQKPEFNWHPGMLMEGTTLQVPFMADLVTMADPKSPYSFLEYLNQHNRLYSFYFYERFHIPRREYNHYCQWVAKQLPYCQFNSRVERIEGEPGSWAVYVRSVDSGSLEKYNAKNLVMGVGTVPVVPNIEGLEPSENIFHTAEFMSKKEVWKNAPVVTVIGSGQSAGEVFYELLSSKSSSQQINWVTRSRGFFPMEYSKLGLEHFSPDYSNYFHSLPQDKKDNLLPKQDLLYKGMSTDTIAAIYDLMYERSIGGEKLNLLLKPLSELERGTIKGDRYTLTFRQWEKNKSFDLDTDAVIMGTGYKPTVPQCLEGAGPLIEWDEKGRFKVKKHYEVSLKPTAAGGGRLFVQNGEVHTHGPGAPDLGLGAHRNAVIINEITGENIYPVQETNVFQQFG
ncbi:lysine N(6)-hydroxylase/L-ornithine N(5)-oxygenase family protein [Alteribacillus bidgolensis]|uniref:L-lysine N6-monooxygenase MbtG n=1 Tax=Alteribacillus bidgolensis TaxID=930129 RepID=A0A1G8IJF0_9BACI|nr:lysine N(6)-hydroxylase/L-ornithine N(5)-oxygenase family protein [Alteribacillus bidgolensis]SDI18660.1 lysine N6-hydroxylase [Alteribacillus bidgolensis]